ncbi:MAG TPA: hypothetical protein VFY81_11260 [Gammaproteobacteria bacterium]|nr:hypothetical protein [Gammaproteobacteria bacterium]
MKKQIAACALVLVMASGAALAHGGPGVGRGGSAGPMKNWFTVVDANSDGVVSQEEMGQRQVERFGRMDANGDQALSVDELHAGLQRERAAGLHKWMDSDGDGKVSLEEFTAAQNKRFSAMDANGDGEISKAEIQQRRLMRHKAKSQAAE